MNPFISLSNTQKLYEVLASQIPAMKNYYDVFAGDGMLYFNYTGAKRYVLNEVEVHRYLKWYGIKTAFKVQDFVYDWQKLERCLDNIKNREWNFGSIICDYVHIKKIVCDFKYYSRYRIEKDCKEFINWKLYYDNAKKMRDDKVELTNMGMLKCCILAHAEKDSTFVFIDSPVGYKPLLSNYEMDVYEYLEGLSVISGKNNLLWVSVLHNREAYETVMDEIGDVNVYRAKELLKGVPRIQQEMYDDIYVLTNYEL